MNTISFSIGSCDAGAPAEQGREAALAALRQAHPLPPALALVVGNERAAAEEIAGGVRQALGECPLVGLVSAAGAAACGVVPPAGVRVFLVSSNRLRAKIGVGRDAGQGWDHQVREAFRDSFIPPSVPDLSGDAAERSLYNWYLYRRPSLAIAAVASPPGQHGAEVARVAAFLKHRLHGRVPLLIVSAPADGGSSALLADDQVVTSGVVLAMVKTDLRFTLERFHSFEPAGAKLFVTKATAGRVQEFNGRPALDAYRQSLGIEPGAAPCAAEGLGPFAVFPLALRGRDGRFHLLQPVEIGADGSLLFPMAVEPDLVLYPMKAVPSSDLWRPAGGDRSALTGPQHPAAALIMRDTGLRDLPEVVSSPSLEQAAVRPIEIPFGRELTAHLSHGDLSGESGHLLLTVERELDPIAVAAAENERLLTEVMQLKDLHQKIFDNIGYGIAVVDQECRIRFCNNTYRELLAGTEAALEGNVCHWSAGGISVCSGCAAAEAVARQEPVNREVVRIEDGKSRWYRLDTFPLRDASGDVSAAIEVVRDITSVKDLLSSLESEQRKMEAVIKGMGETLYIVNARYDLLFFHRGVFPADPGLEQGAGNRRCYEALFQRSLPCPWCRMHETTISGGVERQVAHLAGEEGAERSYQITFSPWGVGQGDQAEVVCLLVDISAQRRLEQQMVLSEKLNSLSILSAGMAHELNNPLGAISFNLEILKRREKDPGYQEVLESIRKDVLRINRIVGNLLSFSRSGAASAGWVSVPGVIDSALELFQVVIERKRIDVRRAYGEGLPSVWGNAQDLQQVFVNFIANAVDAMPSGGTITIGVESVSHAAAAEAANVAVVYDNALDLPALRALADVPGWQVRFYRGDEEAIDSFRQDAVPHPEVLLLDFAEIGRDRVEFFVMMVKEHSPGARVLIVADAAPGGRGVAEMPGIAAVLPRPLDPAQAAEKVGAVVAAVRAQRQSRAEVVVRFEDTGAGIPPEILERIFDPFFTTKETKGTGLGLSVVHKILENHGATVRVSSVPGQGTAFTVRFSQTQEGRPGGQFRFQQEGSVGRTIG